MRDKGGGFGRLELGHGGLGRKGGREGGREERHSSILIQPKGTEGEREGGREGRATYLLDVVLSCVLELSCSPGQEPGTLCGGREGGTEGRREGRVRKMVSEEGREEERAGRDVPRALAIWESLSWMAYILEMGCPKALRSLEYLTAH